MANGLIVVNTKKTVPVSNKVSGTGSQAACVHTVKAQDLRIMKAIPGQAGLSLVLKLGGN